MKPYSLTDAKIHVLLTLLVMFLILLFNSGCVEFSCYTNVSRSIELAHQFCSQANKDKALCSALEIDGKVCGMFENHCMALERGIKTFISIPYYKCRQIKDQNSCQLDPSCTWAFNDPLGQGYDDFFKREIRPIQN